MVEPTSGPDFVETDMTARSSLWPPVPLASVASVLVFAFCARAEAPATAIQSGPTLDARWARALEGVATRSGDGLVWVGWSVRRPEEAVIMSDAGVEVTPGRGGSPLRERAGLDMDSARRRVALLFAFPTGQGDEGRIVATRLRSLWAPMKLGNAPLIWLGEAEDAESIALLERIFARVRSPDVGTEFGPMVAIHADTGVALPVLRRIVRGDLPEEVRAEAIAWIGYQVPDPEVTEVVAEVLGREPSYAILDEALGALVPAEIIRRGLLDRLVDLLRDHPDPQARALVAEALEAYDHPVAVSALEAAARHDPAAVVRLEAVDALADSGEPGAEQALARIAIDAGDPDVRREAADNLEDDSR